MQENGAAVGRACMTSNKKVSNWHGPVRSSVDRVAQASRGMDLCVVSTKSKSLSYPFSSMRR